MPATGCRKRLIRSFRKLTSLSHAFFYLADSLPNRKLLVSLLGRLKCVAQGVEDGQQCVDLFGPWMQGPVLNVAAAAAASAVATHAANANANASPTGGQNGQQTPPQENYPFDIILMDGTMPGTRLCRN